MECNVRIGQAKAEEKRMNIGMLRVCVSILFYDHFEKFGIQLSESKHFGQQI